MDNKSETCKKEILFACLFGFIAFLIFFLFQSQAVVAGDSGDMVTAAVTFGVPHPPGYPLYAFVGWLASQLPFFTPAWRVGLLSSLPHAIVIALVYLLVSTLTKKRYIGVFSAVLLLSNYIFFLYSVTPEVFGLFDLFFIGIIYLLIRRHALSLGAFVFGLSLTHHHVILFLVPACVYWLWGEKFKIKYLVYFLAGLLPYVYVCIAARGLSMINWDRAVDISSFIRLITRSDYGTFVSGGVFGSQLVDRFLQILAYARFIVLDFTWVGVVFIFLGFFSLWKQNRKLCVFFLLALVFIGPGFFFYASFPLANRFTLGTYERFLLPSYILFVIIAGVGLAELSVIVQSMLKQRKLSRLAPLVLGIGFFVLLLYPLSQLGVTFWRFYGMPADRTADNLGRDVLAPLPEHSILLLGRDSTLFSTQYVRYALLFRPDVIVLHTSRLNSLDYQTVIHMVFPQISFSKSGDPITNSIISQYPTVRIFSNDTLNVGTGWYWVPYGLTYELSDKDHLPTAAGMYAQNLAIWKTLHSPVSGILSRYNHLMLSDVRDVYAMAHDGLGQTLVRAGMLEEAYDQFHQAQGIAGDTELPSTYRYEGITRSLQKKCDEALADFTAARKVSVLVNPELLNDEAVTYRDCVGDAARAEKLFKEYDAATKQSQTPLKTL